MTTGGASERATRWMRAVGLGMLGTAVVAAALARLPDDPTTGLVWGLAVGIVASLVGALAARWGVAVLQEEEDAIVMRLDGRGDAAPAIRSPVGEAIDRRLQRHRAELDALKADRAELQRNLLIAMRVSEQSRVGLAIVEDEEGRFTFTNPRFRELCRLRSDPLGRRPLEVVPAVEVHEVVEGALSGQELERDFATGWGDLKVRAERLDDRHVTIRLEDITAEREAERARSDFVANVSHELRTPITALMGYTETLLADAESLPGPLAAMLGTVERNARRLRDLFEDLLRLHRIETRRKQLPLERQRLHPVLVDAVIDAVDRGAQRGVELSLEVDESLDAFCHRDALVAMVGNLARNAVAYTGDGGHVTVRAAEGAQGVLIEVQDDGIGIAPHHLERIFERFYRVDEARSRRAGGTGLGLAIVKHYALATGAEVTVESEHGEGSTFRIQLPPAP